MRIFKSIQKWQDYRSQLTRSLGLVMTMGCLHEGHQSLMQRAVAENEATLLTIFVNPTQFNQQGDLDNYPVTLEADLALAESSGVDAVLLPSYDQLYPDQYRYRVSESELSLTMEGAHRPGHFDGMLSVVLKVLLLAKADRAYFGEKDYQQYQLVQGMVEAFFVETEIVPCPIVRETSGLAMSSRNTRLAAPHYKIAAELHCILRDAGSCEDAVVQLTHLGFAVDYVVTHNSRRFGAASLGDVRLIDNMLEA